MPRTRRSSETSRKGRRSRSATIAAARTGPIPGRLSSHASFVDDLGADSLDTVELVMALEEEFETEIPDEDAEKITTVQQAIDFVTARGSDS